MMLFLQEIRRQLVDDIVKEGTGCSRGTAYRRVYKILKRTVDDVWGLKLQDVAEDESWQPSRFTLTEFRAMTHREPGYLI
mgnify:CR=1 FL=1|jgi:hypothetical protein|tara:strand:+ start:99 stop:338 length:240 start_codon:yes stop_codon:yes gene_type:complete